MSNDGEGNCKEWRQIVREVMTLLTVVFSFYAARSSEQSHQRSEMVQSRQEVVIAKQTEAAHRAAEVKATLDAKAEEDERTMGVQLYSTWKYLEDKAEFSGAATDKAKAAEAKRLYDAHVHRKDGK